MPKVSLTKSILLAAGAAFGALLFAPKPGKEFREDLKTGAKKLGKQTKEQAQTLKEDFKDSYAEAQSELEHEQALMDQKQAQLSQTIQEIERELETEEQSERLAATPESVKREIDLGNVRGTTQDPEEDEVVPKEELDEALHDNYLSDDEEFDVDPVQVENSADEDKTNESGNVAGTEVEPEEDEVVPSDELDEALHDNYLSEDEEFQVDEEEVNK